VTGATGFLGTYLVRHLHNNGLDKKAVRLTALVRNASEVSAVIRAKCRLLESDLANASAHLEEVREMDYVFHLAAQKDFYGGRQLFVDNVTGTRALLEALQGSRRLRRLVFASSIGAVDRCASDTCQLPLTESTPEYPRSWYGRAKLEEERVITASGLPFSVLRLPWCYGPGVSATTHVRALAEMVMNGKPVTKFDWPGRVSLLEARETARALAVLASNPGAASRTCFVSDGAPVQFGELFQAIGRLVGRPAGTIPVPKSVVKAAGALRRVTPFALTCLLGDALNVSAEGIRSLGFSPVVRNEHFLQPLIRSIKQEERPMLHRCKVVITGAASGIGRELAIQMTATGQAVTLVDKDPRVLELANHLPGASSILADLKVEADRSRIQGQFELHSTNGLINCAGIGIRRNVEHTTPADQDVVVRVNVQALTQLTVAAITQFKSAGQGFVVNIESSAAFQPLACMATCSASKAYVLHLSEAIAAVLGDGGVFVIAACPGGVDTRFQESAGVRKIAGEKLLDARDVAAAIVHAVEQRHSQTLVIGWRSLLMQAMVRCLPRRLNASLWKRMMVKSR
jgi:nucleoside-diphosphate-sugar epimerase